MIVKLIQQWQGAGIYRIKWNGRDQFERDVPSGVYVYKLKTKELLQAQKLLIIR